VVDIDAGVMEVGGVEEYVLADVRQRDAFVNRAFIGAVLADDRVGADVGVIAGDGAVFAVKDESRRRGFAVGADDKSIRAVEGNTGWRAIRLSSGAGNM